MGWWSNLRQRIAAFWSQTGGSSGWTIYFPSDATSDASALNYAAVYQAVATISGDIASLPLNVYRRQEDDNREIDRTHPAHWLLNEDANDMMSALTLRETLQQHALLWGNGYAAIERIGSRPSRLIPLLPDRTWLQQYDGQWVYRTSMLDGTPKAFLPDSVLHIKGMGFDGLTGYSILELARSSYNMAIQAERHGDRFFKNAAKPSVVLEVDRLLDKKTADKLLADWNASQAGESNAGKTALAHGGMRVKPISMSNNDSQWLESRKFQRTEIAVWFGIPPHKIGDDSRIAYNSIEAENRAYLTTTLRRWMKKWEDEAERKLLRESERRRFSHFVEHNDGAFLQGDLQTQATVVRTLVDGKIITRNEGRRKLNFNNVEGGDVFENANTASATPATEPAKEPVEPIEPREPANRYNGHRRLVRDRIAKMLRIEAEQLGRAAKTPNKFLAFLDRFYDETFPATYEREFDGILAAVAELVPSVPDASTLARIHATASKAAMLTVAGVATGDDLPHKVQTQCVSWHTRAEEMTDVVFGDQLQEAA